MNPALQMADLVGDAFGARRRGERLLAATFAASVGVHLAAVTLMPAWQRPEETPPPRLEVVIAPPKPLPVRSEPAPALKPPPPPPPAAKPAPQPRTVAREIAPTPERKPVLALPESAAPAQPAFTVPAPVEAPPAPVEAKPAAAAPAAPTPVKEAAPSTPPVYNAAYLHNARPAYPRYEARTGVEGTVRLRVFVTREGRAAEVHLAQTSGSSALDTAAIAAVRNWKFVPAKRGQEPVEQWVEVPVVFKLERAG